MTTLSRLKQFVKSAPLGRTNQRIKAQDAPEWMTVTTDADGSFDAGPGQIWAERSAGLDANNQARTGEKIAVYTGGRNLFVYSGAKIKVAKRDGVLKVVDIDDETLVKAGYEPKTLNNGWPANQWLYLENVSRGKFTTVGTSVSPSLLLGMRGLAYIDNDGTFRLRQLDRQSSKPSLASYVPSAGQHRLVMVFIRAYDNSIQLFGSTAQSIDTEFDETDVQECIDQSIVNEDMPNLVLTLADAQTSADTTDVTDDFRQWLNTPQLPGMPNPLTKNWHIRVTRHELVAAPLEVSGTLTVAGTLRVIDVDTPTSAAGRAKTKTISVADTPYTLEDGYDVIFCDTSGGDITVTLPAISGNDRRASFKNRGTNTVTLVGTIDGQTNLIIWAQYDAPTLVDNGIDWSII
jgi:hypothetical protein